MNLLHLAQTVVGIGLVGYALAAIASKASAFTWPTISWKPADPAAPVPANPEGDDFLDWTDADDLQFVVDLSARLRDQGRTSAVTVCRQLIDELLKPREVPS